MADEDRYTIHEVEYLSGTTDSYTQAVARQYTGFTQT
jgi:hypothetical protein